MDESVKRSEITILPSASAGRIHCSTFCARAANISSSSDVAVSSLLAGSRRMRRICWPIGVPPGSTDSSTGRPSLRKRCASIRACVLLPLPSGPSKVMKRPRLVVDPRLVVNIVQDLLQILPCFFLGVLIVGPQQIGRMVSDHHLDVAPLIPFSAQPRDAVLAEQSFCRRAAQYANRFGTNREKL